MLWLVLLVVAASPDAKKATESVAKMKGAIKPMQRLADESREKKDMVRSNCVSEKLGQATGLLRIAEQSEIALQEALSRRDNEVSAHEYQKIEIAAQKSAQLQKDARSCVGETTVYTGDTQVIVKFTGNASPDPTELTLFDLLVPPLLLRPFQVSPYQ